MPAQEIVTRGDLPHWYVPGTAHFVTYRLAETIPWSVMQQWREERQRLLKQTPPKGLSRPEHRMRLHKKFFAEYDRYLDSHSNRDWLARFEVAEVIRENLYHHDGAKYQLLAYSIMPNHAHVLLQPFERVADAATFRPDCSSDEVPDSRGPLSSIMHSLKSYTANRANGILGRSGQFWQHESYDHWVRGEDEIGGIVDYIRNNPVKAGLCRYPHEWRFSSCYDRFLQDQSQCGLVGWLRDDWRQ